MLNQTYRNGRNMKKFKLSYFLMVMFVLAMISMLIAAQVKPVYAVPEIHEQYTSGDDTYMDGHGTGWRGQTFTVGTVGHNVTSVRLKMYRVGYPGLIDVGIRLTDSGVPTGSDLTSGTIDGDLLTETEPGLWYPIQLTEYTLNPTTQYAIVVRAIDGNSTNYFAWRINYAGTYSGGTFVYSNDSGAIWDYYDPWDYMFEVWSGTPSPGPTPEPGIPPSPPSSDVVNLAMFPNQLALNLGVSLFVGQLLASTILLCLFLFPTMMIAGYFGRSGSVFPAILIVGLSIMGVCVALTWLPVWVFAIVALLIGLLFADKITKKV